MALGDKAGSKREGRSALPRVLSFGRGRGERGGGWEVKMFVFYHHRLFCFVCVWFVGWFYFVLVWFYFVLFSSFFLCRFILTASSALLWWEGETENSRMNKSHFCCEKKGMLVLCPHSVCSCFYSSNAEPKICLSREHIKTLAHCNLEYLPSGCVSMLIGTLLSIPA